jgi:hypothetical protein
MTGCSNRCYARLRCPLVLETPLGRWQGRLLASRGGAVGGGAKGGRQAEAAQKKQVAKFTGRQVDSLSGPTPGPFDYRRVAREEKIRKLIPPKKEEEEPDEESDDKP